MYSVLVFGARAGVLLPEPCGRTRAKRVTSRHTSLSSDGWPMETSGIDSTQTSGKTPARVMQLAVGEAEAPEVTRCQVFLMESSVSHGHRKGLCGRVLDDCSDASWDKKAKPTTEHGSPGSGWAQRLCWGFEDQGMR